MTKFEKNGEDWIVASLGVMYHCYFLMTKNKIYKSLLIWGQCSPAKVSFEGLQRWAIV